MSNTLVNIVQGLLQDSGCYVLLLFIVIQHLQQHLRRYSMREADFNITTPNGVRRLLRVMYFYSVFTPYLLSSHGITLEEMFGKLCVLFGSVARAAIS